MIDDEIEGSDNKTPCNGWVIKNNIFDSSENIDTGIMNHPIRKVALGIRGKDINYISDNNLLHNRDGYVASFGDDAGTLYSLPDYQKVSGQDKNSIDVSPQFIDASKGNFELLPSSPAINKGINLGFQTDLSGNTLPKIGPVTMGAFFKEK